VIVELHDRFRQPLTVPATRVLVSYEDGTPIVLIVQLGTDHVRVFRAGDRDFNHQLKAHGIDRTVIVDHPKFAPLEK
jgi:hypothetical protein